MDKLDKNADGSSLNIVQDNIDTLKTLFPDIFSEGKIDFDALREILGVAVETAEERYNFTWHGKSAARRIAQMPSTGTLRPCKAESKDWDTTQNLFIEGDNLEVLKLLQKSYHKQVKMIYIDPPYNTGKEFIYPDNYKDNLDTYLEYTGQKDSEGRKFGTNAETSGRYHTNWLNMMYPRLKLARNLYEILLKYGLDLTVPIEERQIGDKTVYAIGFGALVICLDDEITLDVVEGIGGLKAELEPEVMRVVFKDSGFHDDVVKTNAIQILKKYGIDDVKSL